MRGEPNRSKIALTNAHDTVRELVVVTAMRRSELPEMELHRTFRWRRWMFPPTRYRPTHLKADGTLRWDSTTLIVCEIHARRDQSDLDIPMATKPLPLVSRLSRREVSVASLGVSISQTFTRPCSSRYATTVAAASHPWRSRRWMLRSGISKPNCWVPLLSICWVLSPQGSCVTGAEDLPPTATGSSPRSFPAGRQMA